MTVDAPFRDKIEAQDAPKMPLEYQALLKTVVPAMNKRGLVQLK